MRLPLPADGVGRRLPGVLHLHVGTVEAGNPAPLAGAEWIVLRGSRNPNDPLEMTAGGGILTMTAYVLTGPLACDLAPACSQPVSRAATCKLVGAYSFLVLTNNGSESADVGYTITVRNTVASL